MRRPKRATSEGGRPLIVFCFDTPAWLGYATGSSAQGIVCILRKGKVMDLGNILALGDPALLLQLGSAMFIGRILSPDEVRHLLELCGALWTHSGEPRAPHAELTSGNCSDGFVDVLRATRYANVCRIFASQLVQKSNVDRLMADSRVSWVVGSDHAGATISFAVAESLHAKHDFTEKVVGTPDGKSTQAWKRFTIAPEEIVLQVEDLVTTMKTLADVQSALQRAHPENIVRFAPIALTVVNRSGTSLYNGMHIISLLNVDINVWKPEFCPLCKQGSKRLRPKQNWTELTGQAA